MSDEDHSSAGAGASLTIPTQCSALRKGGFVVISGRPCRVMDMSTSKTGKHGHAKVNYTGIDIFTGKKYEDMSPSTHNVDVPVIKKVDLQLVDIDDEGYMSLMSDSGETRSDVKLPSGNDDAEALAAEIRGKFESEADILVSICSAMGEEHAVGWKAMTK